MQITEQNWPFQFEFIHLAAEEGRCRCSSTKQKCPGLVYTAAVNVIKHLHGITQENGTNNKYTTSANLLSVHIVMQLFQDLIIILRTDTSVRKKVLLLVEMMATNVKFVRKFLQERIHFKNTYLKCTVRKGTIVACVQLLLPKAIS